MRRLVKDGRILPIRFQAPGPAHGQDQHKRRATFRLLGDRGVLRGVCRYRRGVAEGGEDPWLCGPGFRRVCLCRGMVHYFRCTRVPNLRLPADSCQEFAEVDQPSGALQWLDEIAASVKDKAEATDCEDEASDGVAEDVTTCCYGLQIAVL
jgi:hypothetical protein